MAESVFADDEAVTQAFVQRGDALQQDVHHLLRALHYAGTVNTSAASTSLTELLADFGQWKTQLEDVLLNDKHPVFVSLSSKVPLLAFYFQLVTNLIRIKQTTAPPLLWSEWGEQFALRAPRPVAWHYSAALQKLWAQKLVLINDTDTTVRLQLKDAFVAGVQIATIARNVNDNSHLQAIKFLTYTTLYRQLARNAFYRGETDSNALLPAAGYAQSDLRQRIIAHMYHEQQKTHQQRALLATLPQLSIPAEGLQKPLLANWELYEQLVAAHPQLTTFTTSALAEKIYALLTDTQKYAISVSDTEDMRRFMLLAEHLLLPIQLTKNLQAMPVEIDDSDTSIVALQQAMLRSRFMALLATTEQLQFSQRQKRLLDIYLRQRERELQKNSPQQIAQWYDRATTQLTDSKDKLRQNFITKVLISARHAANIEVEAADKSINLPILRKALMHSLFVMDFSGEVQKSLDAVLRQQDYQQSRKVFFQELQKHFARLLPAAKLDQHKLATMSHDDIVNTHINPALARLDEHEQQTVQAIARQAKVNHIAQLKSLLQYGYWFGYLADYGKAMPTLAMLPLDKRQRADYLQELKFVYLDEYPFLLLEKNGKKLYSSLAAMVEDKDIATLDTEAIWSILSQALELQYTNIKTKMAEIDGAESLQDIKHLAAGSPILRVSMKEFDGLYPLHEEFVKRHNQPSKFQHNWETINMDYIGSFFTVMIGYHLGGWLLRRSMFGSVGGHVLSVLNPLFGGATPYAMPLLHAMWGVILLEYFVAMPYHTFVIKPQKLRELQEYYQLGSAQNNLINGTYLNYYRQERNGHFLNYALDMSMHVLFVGWWAYSLKFSHIVPKLKENNLQKLLKRVGIDGSSKIVYKLKHNIFKPDNIKKQAQQQIDKLEKATNVSRHYRRERIHQIKTAEQKLLTIMEDKKHAIKVASIEHRHDFVALGMNEAVFDFNTIARAYGLIKYGYKTGVYDAATLQQAELAMGQLHMTLMRRLKISPLRLSKDKIAEETYQRALGEAVAEKMFPERSKKVLDLAILNFYLKAAGMEKVASLEKIDKIMLRQLRSKLAGKLPADNPIDYFLNRKTFKKELFSESGFFTGYQEKIINATPEEMRELIKHIKTIGVSTRGIKTLEDVRVRMEDIKTRYKAIKRNTAPSLGLEPDPNQQAIFEKVQNAYDEILKFIPQGGGS